jgi:hypothetical protein
MRRLVGVWLRPRSTMAAVVAAPAVVTTWIAVLVIWLVPAAWLLSTAVGQQALVDERVRVVEALGGRVDDAEYERLMARPPVWAYFLGGGRLLLTPPVTVVVAAGLTRLARLDGGSLGFLGALAVSVHAALILALQQAVTTPVLYLRESLTAPTSLAGLFPVFDDGTFAARLLGIVDVFGLWWLWALALGVAAATGRPARRAFGRLAVVYVGVALATALGLAVLGGS